VPLDHNVLYWKSSEAQVVKPHHTEVRTYDKENKLPSLNRVWIDIGMQPTTQKTELIQRQLAETVVYWRQLYKILSALG
jgi:hypothetical protein